MPKANKNSRAGSHYQSVVVQPETVNSSIVSKHQRRASHASKSSKQLTKTDIILLQKQTEKLARDTLQNMAKATPRQESELVFEWCFSSITTMMNAMSFS